MNGQAAKALVTRAALQPGDIVSGQILQAVYDGTQFQLIGGSQVTPGAIQFDDYIYGTDPVPPTTTT